MDSYEKNILGFRDQLEGKGLTSYDLHKLRGFSPDGIILMGMGGSGMAAMIFERTASRLGVPIPVRVVEDAALPQLPFKRPLFVCISFSGVTPETIAATKTAIGIRGGKVTMVTTGGPLLRLGVIQKLPRVVFRAGDLTPRGAYGYMYYAILEIVKRVLPIKVPTVSRLISPSRMRLPGKKLAKKLLSAPVLIYPPSPSRHLGYIWKINLNETAKIPAFVNEYPELYHEEIAGFEKARSRWNAIWLTSSRLKNEESKKMKKAQSLLGMRRVKNLIIPLEGKNDLEELWNLNILSHWTSFYMAKAQHLDPKVASIINELKRPSK